MSSNKKYTLDRIEEGMYVFWESPEEMNQLVLPTTTFDVTVDEGDIVCITFDGIKYHLEVFKEETLEKHKKVSALLEKLKNKSN
ncbi:DUF3006 family protein [Psychrobacillus sp. FSL K6-2684]|uniref:DUF3006 family protein n=1 Tax=unclassified Psychrobacillus TaxID=2636677 RepID=UPI0012492E45|nr:DUF3006 family protein [Psychrobacillus sp. AK 1817]QEY22324.1 DUF3006 domain-containing protein [Psychrobacillus sp. AK 1817]